MPHQSGGEDASHENVRVCVRLRPMSQAERERERVLREAGGDEGGVRILDARNVQARPALRRNGAMAAMAPLVIVDGGIGWCQTGARREHLHHSSHPLAADHASA